MKYQLILYIDLYCDDDAEAREQSMQIVKDFSAGAEEGVKLFSKVKLQKPIHGQQPKSIKLPFNTINQEPK